MTRDMLPIFGAIPVERRVVADRNRMTGGGITAGLDFGLTLVSKLRGEETARLEQLILEYDPQPPFTDGSMRTARRDTAARALGIAQPTIGSLRAVAQETHARRKA